MSPAIQILFALSFAVQATKQEVPQAKMPEGVYKPATGPTTICGITANTAREFEVKVRMDKSLRRGAETDRYMLYQTDDSMKQWLFAKPKHAAYPLATCRHVYEADDGSLMMNRNMRCDASRVACDAAFIEVKELDDKVREALGG